MPWGRLEDTLHQNGKVWSFSDKAFRLWAYSISFCNAKRRKDPEGNISREEALGLCRIARAPASSIDELVRKRGWDQADDGCYRLHDFTEYGPNTEDPATASRRQQLFRDAELRGRIKERDQDRCRYCDIKVQWHDRRGPAGGTFDHVDPEGPNTEENVVVACRGCNSRKHARTPEEAGMALQSVPRFKSDLDRGSNADLDRNSSALMRARARPVPGPVPVPDPIPGSRSTDRPSQEETPEDITPLDARAIAVPKRLGVKAERVALSEALALALGMDRPPRGGKALDAWMDDVATLDAEGVGPADVPALVRTAEAHFSVGITSGLIAKQLPFLRAPLRGRGNGRGGGPNKTREALDAVDAGAQRLKARLAGREA